MELKIIRAIALMMIIAVFLLASAIKSYSESVEATIEYVYDGVGNIIEKKVTYSTSPGSTDTNPPITIAYPGGDTYTSPISVTLVCYDASSAGCDKIFYTMDGTTPNTSSLIYSSPINISVTTTLKFFARDVAGNSETVKSETYIIDFSKPTGTITINSGAASTNSRNVILTLTCEDVHGCNQMQFSNDGSSYGGAVAYASTYAYTLTSGDGTKTVYVKFKDTQGTLSDPYSDSILLDTAVPTTTASPAGGTYYGARSVTLSCSDGTGSGCDKIYYTTDGSTPTTSSPVYSSPINISVTTTLKYFAKDLAGNSESVKTQNYTIRADTTAPTTTASPTGGTYSDTQSITLSCSDGTGVGCDKIYYTTDGTTPTASSPIYSSPIPITDTATLKYFAKDLAGNSETVKTQNYTIIRGSITINPGPPVLEYTNSRNVTLGLNCTTSGGCSQMRFSNNGSTYTAAEAYNTTKAWTLTNGDGTKTVYVKFKNTAGTWSTPFSDTILLDRAAPATTASPAQGTYYKVLDVVLTCNDGTGSGCDKIYYTTDGSTPTTSSAIYSSPIPISSTGTLKFFAKDLAGNSEAVKTQNYTINLAPTGTITINSDADSTNTENVTLSLTCSSSPCSMQFSNTGSSYSSWESFNATKSWTLTSGDGTKTVYVKFKNSQGYVSDPYVDGILLDKTKPTSTASPAGGIYKETVSVTLSCDDGTGSGCDKIYYTTDGNDPTTSSPVYSSPINISVSTTLKYIAKDLAGNSETPVKSQIYTIDTTDPTGTVTINSGSASTNSGVVNLSLTCNDNLACSQMQFSNDRVNYSTPEAYNGNKTWTLSSGDGIKTVYVKYKDTAGNWSWPVSDTILLDTTAPMTSAMPARGTYSSALSVTLSCSDESGVGCDQIHYTTNGNDPTTSSPTYSSPINISVTTTLKFFAKDLLGNTEAVKTERYFMDGCLNPPVRIGSTSYATLQSAYDAAVNGDVIKCRNAGLVGNLIVNRNVSVTIEGGYDCEFTTNVGGKTILNGILVTTSDGGKITIKNFILGK